MALGLNLVQRHGKKFFNLRQKPTNCLGVFDQFLGWGLKGLIFVYWYLSWRKDLNQLLVIPLTS